MILAKKIKLFYMSSALSKPSRDSLRRNLSYIFTFPEFKQRLLLHPKLFFFTPSRRFFQYCETNVQKAAEEILNFLRLTDISVKITHEFLHLPKELTSSTKFGPGLPGQIYSLTKYQFTVFVNNNFRPRIKAAILAHELSHAFIRYTEIQFKTGSPERKRFDEQMTDLTTVAL